MDDTANTGQDNAGPTLERLKHSGGSYSDVGLRAGRRVTMLDDPLAKAWMRRKISGEEYSALRRYALHWLAGGLSGHLGSIDLDRVFAHDPSAMSGLSKTERQQDHRDAYRAAKFEIGTRPSFVADQVACAGFGLSEVGVMLGYRSAAHARLEAARILSDAGYRLGQFFKDRDR